MRMQTDRPAGSTDARDGKMNRLCENEEKATTFFWSKYLRNANT